MTNPYLGVLVLLAVASGFVIFMLLMSIYIGPKFTNKTKELPWECGAVSVGDVREHRFNVRFYLVAMLFIVFDVEVIFMYPWAVNFVALGTAGFWAMASFVFLLFGCFLYVVKRGVLDWND